MPKPKLAQINPPRVRYIKLGRQGIWEQECVKNGIVRLGFKTANPARLAKCRGGNWAELTKSFLEEGKDKGTATRFTNEVKLFFEDPGTTLWIAFVGERLYWGFFSDEAKPHADGNGTWRRIEGGWRCQDLNNDELTKDKLSGALTKLAAFRGTTCDVIGSNSVVQRINGLKNPVVERAIAAMSEMHSAIRGMIQLLGPMDFEILVGLIFATSGWRRQGIVGGTEKTKDLDRCCPVRVSGPSSKSNPTPSRKSLIRTWPSSRKLKSSTECSLCITPGRRNPTMNELL